MSIPNYQWFIGGFTGVVLFSFFVYHIHYLAFIKFDYGYNIKANIAVGNNIFIINML